MQAQALGNLVEAQDRAKQNSIASENNYKKNLDKMNLNVDSFYKDFQPLLNKIQENDMDQLDFIKFSLEKLGAIIQGTQS